MSKHKMTYTPLGYSIKLMSVIISWLASLQATLIMWEGRRNK